MLLPSGSQEFDVQKEYLREKWKGNQAADSSLQVLDTFLNDSLVALKRFISTFQSLLLMDAARLLFVIQQMELGNAELPQTKQSDPEASWVHLAAWEIVSICMYLHSFVHLICIFEYAHMHTIS